MKKGDTVYDIHGHQAVLEQILENGSAVVFPVYEYGDDERQCDDPTIWDEVFDSVPTEKLHQEIADLQAKKEAVAAELKAAKDEWRKHESEINRRKELLKRHEQLSCLEDLLEGRITHYVTYCEYRTSFEIVDIFDTKSEYGDGVKMRMVSIQGLIKNKWEKNPKIEFVLNSYYDGSGSNSRIMPCKSYEEGVEIGRRFLEAQWQALRDSTAVDGAGYKPIGHLKSQIETANKYGIPVPEDMLEMLKSDIERDAQHAVNEAQKKLDFAIAKKAALTK